VTEPRNKPVELLLPIARRAPPIPGSHPAFGLIPTSLVGKVAGAFQGEDAMGEIGHAFGRAAKPRKPVLLWGPDNKTLMVIIGDGDAEAAELEDIAQQAYDKAETNMKKFGRAVDIDSMRERAGAPRREEVDPMIRQAFRDHAAKLKQNRRTMT